MTAIPVAAFFVSICLSSVNMVSLSAVKYPMNRLKTEISVIKTQIDKFQTQQQIISQTDKSIIPKFNRQSLRETLCSKLLMFVIQVDYAHTQMVNMSIADISFPPKS
ncbi:Hypothetical predicted protein [Xyrichtys novacula]|uniref:Uncharacterized protein n=1 Tax=Xyrichtys novacula TaxID=13765 RepID=A0AAV1G1S4_XYRNO|nr:Hypothetical predicted protein [Xyrichtys novacula]